MYNNDPANQVSRTQSSNANITVASQSVLSLTTRSSATCTIQQQQQQQPDSQAYSNYLGSLKDRIGDLYQSNIFADVTFSVGEVAEEGGRRTDVAVFPAHKLILAISSPVFAAMLYGPMKNQDGQEIIVIPDCKPAAFSCLLKFAYKNELAVTEVQLALDTLYAARKYSMKLLEDECLSYLCANVSTESVLAVKEAAEKYNLPALETICREYIEDNAYQVLKSHYSYLNSQAIAHFAQNGSLNIKEIELFQILLDWAEQECIQKNLEATSENKRKVLEPVLNHIRFPIMTAAEVADHVVPSGLLSTAEVAQVLTYISATDKTRVDVPPFPTEPRKVMQSVSSTTPVFFDTPDTTIAGRIPSRHRSRKRSRNR